jgi:serine/threonine protein kinase/tetratricopeptide (TPR) repeat protein
MDHTHWQRIEELFERAHAQPVEARPRFLAEACGTDVMLRDEIDAMLATAGPDRALAIERFIVDRASNAPDVGPLFGSRLGAWRLVGVLGRGGMGTVYRAERADGHYRQEVAIKILRSGPCDRHAIDRFRTERQVLAHLTHPNIAGLLDGGFAPDGTPYLVMELVEGVPISEWCAAQRLPLEARLRLFRVACDAVQHAHRALVVHRDLKPSNIFVSQSGIVKLLDFGIAKLLDPGAWDVGSEVTRSELRLITPEYAAPEQRRDGPITTATDVYALGVVLYELLTGLRPRELTGSTRSSHQQDLVPSPVIAPSEVVRRFTSNRSPLERTRESTDTDVTWSVADRRRLFRRIRGDLDRIVLNALREEPERRYASAGQLGEEIERFLAGRAVLAQPDTVGYRARKFVGRNRLAVTTAAVFISCIVAFGLVATVQARALAEQSRVAGLERDKAEQVVRVLVDLFETTNPAVRPGGGDRMTVREFLTGAEGRALAQLRGTPAVRAKLKQVFGLIHHERGELALARDALEEALGEQRRLSGPDRPDALESLHALGRVMHAAGDEPRARSLLEESLDRHRHLYGEEHEKTARALFALAPLAAAENLEAGEKLLTQALEIRRRVLPSNHQDIAVNLGALAEHYRRRGELERARELYRQALAVFRDPAERYHPRAVNLMNDYGSLLSIMKQYAEAETLQREAIAIGRQVLGADTLAVANLTNNLAVTLSFLGRFADAERAFREAFDQHVSLLGDNHWRVRNNARNIGRILTLQKQYDEALSWMDRAVAIGLNPATAEDPGIEGMRSQRAWILFRLGRRAEALQAVTAAVSALERMTQPNDGYALAFSRVLRARILVGMGRPDQAEAPLRAALVWFERWGRDHPSYADAECELGRAKMLQGAIAEGKAAFERCLPIYRAWGLADREIVESIERLLADSK